VFITLSSNKDCSRSMSMSPGTTSTCSLSCTLVSAEQVPFSETRLTCTSSAVQVSMTRVKCPYESPTRLTAVLCGVNVAVSRDPKRYWRAHCTARGVACQCVASARSNWAMNSAEVSLFIVAHCTALRAVVAWFECDTCGNQVKVNTAASSSALCAQLIIF
jgi:hypothetical protein